MEPYRRRLVGLPLQRSLFAAISRAPEAIGMHGVLPGDRFAAWLDDDGDLFLDQSDIERLTAALPALATEEFLGAMGRRLAATCSAVVATTERSQRCAPQANEIESRTLLADLGAAVAALIPFGILSKFVPDALYEIMKATGETGDPPFPAVSPGAELTRAAANLYGSCRRQGFAPYRLKTEWPEVPQGVASVVKDFCRAQTGFGPLAWEAPGYEDPQYVFGILQGTFGDEDRQPLIRERGAPIASQRQGGDTPLRQVLAAWLDFLDRETWYVRRAFYFGFVPLLRRLVPAYRQADSGFVPEDLLFLELDELNRSPAPTAATRRARYLADSVYYAKYGITADRLRAVMETV